MGLFLLYIFSLDILLKLEKSLLSVIKKKFIVNMLKVFSDFEMFSLLTIRISKKISV